MADKRILTKHAGSLLRPAHLAELYAARAKGEKSIKRSLSAKAKLQPGGSWRSSARPASIFPVTASNCGKHSFSTSSGA